MEEPSELVQFNEPAFRTKGFQRYLGVGVGMIVCVDDDTQRNEVFDIGEKQVWLGEFFWPQTDPEEFFSGCGSNLAASSEFSALF